MSLAAYRGKRRFSSTPEPKGKKLRRRTGRLYIMHKHRARNLHYDLRLELDGVLKSWAIPKGPSLDPREKRLAIQVEDHPIEYGQFEGNIPEGEYGAGTAIVWDRGSWEPVDDPHEGLWQGKVKFELHGEKLRGGWALVAAPRGRRSRQPQWLLVKVKDAEARSHDEINVVEQFPNSVDSGQSVEETAASPPAKKKGTTSATQQRVDLTTNSCDHQGKGSREVRRNAPPGIEASLQQSPCGESDGCSPKDDSRRETGQHAPECRTATGNHGVPAAIGR